MTDVAVLTKLFSTNVKMSTMEPGSVASSRMFCESSERFAFNCLPSSGSTSGVSDCTSDSLSPPQSPLTSAVFSDEQDADSGDSSSGNHTLRSSKKISRVSRQQRNLAEKQRRDKLNLCIGKLAAMVPMVSMSSKRINKSGVLRLAASYLRLHHGLLKGLTHRREWKPLFLTNQELGSFLLEALDGFVIIVNELAKVVFVSEGIERVLGHSVIDVLGQNVLDIVHQDDKATFDDNVMQELSSWEYMDESGESELDKENFARVPVGISFFCSMVEHNSDPRMAVNPGYKLVNVIGKLKLISNSIEEDNTATQGKVGKFFIGVVKLCTTQPYKQLSVSLNTNPNEVSFRSTLDGRFVFVDQRLSVVLGYLPSEVIGVSGYEIIFHEDHPLSAVAHTQLLRDGGFRGVPVRLVTRTKSILYFNTCGRIIHSPDPSIPDTMLCVCSKISNEEGEKALALARHRFMPYTLNLDLSHMYDAIVNKNAHFLSPVSRELQLKWMEEPPRKRPRGRPRKYPIGSTHNTSRLPHYLQFTRTEDRRAIEDFIRSYAIHLNLNMGPGNRRRNTSLNDLDVVTQLPFGEVKQPRSNSPSRLDSRGLVIDGTRNARDPEPATKGTNDQYWDDLHVVKLEPRLQDDVAAHQSPVDDRSKFQW